MLVFQRIFFNKFSQRLESGNFREKNIYRQPTGRDPESYVGHELYGETRVATKISRNEIPRYFVLFLFRIFAKILGKIPRNFAEFRFAKMFLFRHISRNSVDLVQII